MRTARIKASRSPYRRAGFTLGSADWVELPEDLEPARLVVLMRDPVIVMQAFDEDDDAWKTVPMPDRLENASVIAAWLASGAPEITTMVDGVVQGPAPVPSADGRRPVDESPTLAPEPREPLVAGTVKPAPARSKGSPGSRKPGGMRGR